MNTKIHVGLSEVIASYGKNYFCSKKLCSTLLYFYYGQPVKIQFYLFIDTVNTCIVRNDPIHKMCSGTRQKTVPCLEVSHGHAAWVHPVAARL